MPRPAPLALVVWLEAVGMGTMVIANVTGGTIGRGAMTVIATGIGDTVIVGSEYYVKMTLVDSLLLTLCNLNGSERRRSRSPDRRRY